MQRVTILVLACLIAGLAFGQWVVRPTGTFENLSGIAVRGPQGATVVGANSTILYTEDDGFDWGPQQGEPEISFSAVSFADHDTGLIAGDAGTILFTTSAGTTWQTKETGWMHPYHAAHQLSGQIGAVAGMNSIFQPIVGTSTNGWQTHDFFVFYPQQGDTMYEGAATGIHFLDANVGFASVAVWDGQGAICRTTDGGAIWQTVYWNPLALYGIDFANADTGCAVGMNGTILFTADGGLVWSAAASPTNQTLSEVSYGSSSSMHRHVWAVGQNGTILYSANGGESGWTVQTSPVGTHLWSVDFVNADTGYIAGDNGAVLYTSNAGGAVSNHPPGEFVRLTPLDSIAYSQAIQFEWTPSVDPDGDQVSYLLRIWSSDNPQWTDSTLALTTTGTEIFFEPPYPYWPDHYTMKWTVRATDGIDTVAATNGQGEFYLTTTIIRADDPGNQLPREFALSAYPNPFNATTTLNLSLPVSSEVIIRIFDITGRLAHEQHLGQRTAGVHTIFFDGADLPSGVYLATIQTSSTRLTQKLVLMK